MAYLEAFTLIHNLHLPLWLEVTCRTQRKFSQLFWRHGKFKIYLLSFSWGFLIWGGSWDCDLGEILCLLMCYKTLMCVRVLLCMCVYVRTYSRRESTYLLCLYMCVHYVSLHVYVKINKMGYKCNSCRVCTSEEALHPPIFLPTVGCLCLYWSRADKTHWINVNLYSPVPECFSSNEFYFFFFAAVRLFWIKVKDIFMTKR